MTCPTKPTINDDVCYHLSVAMPNGHDKNWIRLLAAIDGFRCHFGTWPKRVRLYSAALCDIRDDLLSPQAFARLTARIELVADDEAPIVAEDDEGNSYSYGELGFPPDHPDDDAETWLGVEPDRGPDPHTMVLKLTTIEYCNLNARQKENFNFLKVSAVLADYGFMTLRLTDDWQGADFIAQHIDGKTFLKIQLKGRLSFSKKYCGKDLYIAFCHETDWYLYPHDEVLDRVLSETSIGSTVSWSERGGYSFPGLSKQMARIVAPYCIGPRYAEATR